MDREYRSRTRSDIAFDFGRVELPGIRERVDKYGRSSDVAYGVDGSNVCQGWHYNFVARPNSQREHCEVQRYRSIAYTDGVRYTDEVSKAGFESLDEVALG